MTVKIVQYGVGCTGIEMTKQIIKTPGLELVGAIDIASEKRGKDLGELAGFKREIGVKISDDAEKTLRNCNANLVLHATTSSLEEMFQEMCLSVNHGLNAISICGPFFYPWKQYPKLAKRLNDKCLSKGVTAIGTGLNPGFVNDTLPLFFSGLCTDIERIHCSRCTDFTPYSKAVHDNFGIGLSSAETFNEKIGQGALPMHRGLTQSMDLIADTIGWEIDQKKQEALPIITQTSRKTPYVEIYPGTVVGCRQILSGLENGMERIVLENVAIVKPDAEIDGFEPIEVTKIYGNPHINITTAGELGHKGAIATAARAVNLIPRVIDSKPGYLSSVDLPPAVSLKTE